MRALFLKEIRQGRPLLIFSFTAALLLAAGYHALGRMLVRAFYAEPSSSDITIAFGFLVLATPLLVAVFAGSGLFAGEAEHNTLPILFALPLSRRRIWLAKILAGLALTAVSALVVLGLGSVLAPRACQSLPLSAYLPDLALALVFVFAAAALISSVTGNFVAALVGTLLLGGAIGLGLGVMWSELGALLLGYSPILDIALWGFLVVPALLVAGALAITRGELLDSWRKHVFAIPALVVGLLVTVLLVSGLTRWATTYRRDEVASILPLASAQGAPVLAVIARADPVPFERLIVGVGWKRRDFDWTDGQTGDLVSGPLYRSNAHVVLDLKGRELLSLRSAYTDYRTQVACSPDGRFAAITPGPVGLTWGVQSWGHVPQNLQVFDLASRKRLYSDVPAPLLERKYLEVTQLAWSARGDYLAFATVSPSESRFSSSMGLYVVRPDGSGLRDLAVRPDSDAWAWSPAKDVIYAADRGRLYRVSPTGGSPQPIWPADPAARPFTRPALRISPDGRWVALVERRLERLDDDTTIETAAVRVVSADGKESRLLGSWTPEPRRLHQPGREDQMVGTAAVRLAWSADGHGLYATASAKENEAQLYRWRPGEDSFTPLGARLPYAFAALAARPDSGELLIWPYPGRQQEAQHGPIMVSADGGIRAVPDAATSVRFAKENRFVAFDDAGRLITVRGTPPNDVLSATDLATGRTAPIYP